MPGIILPVGQPSTISPGTIWLEADGVHCQPESSPLAPSNLPPGGSAGQALVKASASNYDVVWADAAGSSSTDLLRILAPIMVDMSLARSGFENGWLDSLADQSNIAAGSLGTWAAGSYSAGYGVNQTAVMTSNTTPTGVTSASSEYSATYQAWKAFNHSSALGVADAWISSTTGTQWLQYQFPADTTVFGYAIKNRPPGVEVASPNTWKLQSSDDGSSWVDRHTVTNSTNNDGDFLRAFTLPASVSARYWRLSITAGNGGSSYYAVGELELYGATATTLISMPATAGAAATSVYVVAVIEGITVSTGVSLSASSDGGSSWTFGTITASPIGADAILVEALVAVPSGTNLVSRVQLTEAIAGAAIKSWGISW